MFVPVVLGAPAMSVFIPPSVVSAPAMFALFVQSYPRAPGLRAVPAMMLRCFMHPMIRSGYAVLAVFVLCCGPWCCAKQQKRRHGSRDQYGLPKQLDISLQKRLHQSIPPLKLEAGGTSQVGACLRSLNCPF